MHDLHVIAVRASMFLAVVDEDELDGLAARLRREMQHGRSEGAGPVLLPAVTVEMAVIYRQCPERN